LEQLINLIMNSYKESIIQMQTKQGLTDKITIGKGVKQGCTLSPILFNLGIHWLIRNIRENYQECGYNYDEQLRKIIQAHADDLLIFSDIREHLNIWVDVLEDFMKYTHIHFNQKKCKLLIRNPEKGTIIPRQLPNENENYNKLVWSIKDTIKYLGVPLETRKLQKMKFSKCEIEK
jgi:hypothetical protein